MRRRLEVALPILASQSPFPWVACGRLEKLSHFKIELTIGSCKSPLFWVTFHSNATCTDVQSMEQVVGAVDESSIPRDHVTRRIHQRLLAGNLPAIVEEEDLGGQEVNVRPGPQTRSRTRLSRAPLQTDVEKTKAKSRGAPC